MRWAVPPDYPQYLVSDEGNVLRLQKPQSGGFGYLKVTVPGATPRSQYIGYLVAETFGGPRPTGHVIAYRDNDRQNNHAANVEWASRGEVLRRRWHASYAQPVTEATGEWRRHPTFPQLLVCDDGRVARDLHPANVNGGYQRLTVASRPVYVHRLILSAFVRLARAGEVTNHLDANPSNNRIENLEWVTQGENLAHRYRVTGHPAVGAKLTPDQVRALRALPRSVTHKQAAEMFSVHPVTAFRARKGKYYAGVI